MSSFLWISVIVKCGCIIVIQRKVLQCSFEDTFGDIVHKLQLTSTVEKVSISNNAMFVDPNQCTFLQCATIVEFQRKHW